MEIYLISGLGADRTIFRNLAFSNTTKIHYLDWIPPKTKESLRAYALRLAESIDQSVPFSIIGLSFGGMLATEIASVVNPRFTVLVSSVPAKRDLPSYLGIIGTLGIHRLVPVYRPKSVPRFIASFFGVESGSDYSFFLQLLRRTNPRFSRWAMNAIIKWDRTEIPPGVVRIHGDKDRILPLGKGKADYRIRGGGHFMIYNRAEEISKILADLGVG